MSVSPGSSANSPATQPAAWHGVSAGQRLGTAVGVGVIVGGALALSGVTHYALLLGWIGAGTVFVGWMWISIWPMDADATAAHAAGENPGRGVTELTMILAAVASLSAVGLLLAGGSGNKTVSAALSITAVALAWATVHTIFTTRYARLYYTGKEGGIDFNEDDPPQYSDFAYLAFTIGMTFQVSDTDLQTKAIRASALRQALLSYLFGAFIIATTINLVAGLGK